MEIPCYNFGGNGRIQVSFPPADRLETRYDVAPHGLFEQIASHTFLEKTGYVFLIFILCQHEHFYVRPHLFDFDGYFEVALLSHIDVHDDDIWAEFAENRKRLPDTFSNGIIVKKKKISFIILEENSGSRHYFSYARGRHLRKPSISLIAGGERPARSSRAKRRIGPAFGTVRFTVSFSMSETEYPWHFFRNGQQGRRLHQGDST
jgi:hypothetical protein